MKYDVIYDITGTYTCNARNKTDAKNKVSNADFGALESRDYKLVNLLFLKSKKEQIDSYKTYQFEVSGIFIVSVVADDRDAALRKADEVFFNTSFEELEDIDGVADVKEASQRGEDEMERE